MEATAIFGPFFGMIALTLAVWLFMFGSSGFRVGLRIGPGG
jgi:hypothetical protein